MVATDICRERQTQEALLKTHGNLVKRIAHHIMGHLPTGIPLEDFIQVGMLGLLEAHKNYDASKGAAFETYAGIRIRGYMLDEIRNNDWIPRSVHRNARLIALAVRNLENRLGRQASDREIAAELQLDLCEYYELLKESAAATIRGFDDFGLNEESLAGEVGSMTEPHNQAMQEDILKHLTQMIEHLPYAERIVLSLYYEQDLNLKEVSEVLGVSESRISQILTQATLRLKSRFPRDK